MGIYDTMSGVGAHEVIIESPLHITSLTEMSIWQVEEILWTYRDRMIDLKRTNVSFTDCCLKMWEEPQALSGALAFPVNCHSDCAYYGYP